MCACIWRYIYGIHENTILMVLCLIDMIFFTIQITPLAPLGHVSPIIPHATHWDLSGFLALYE